MGQVVYPVEEHLRAGAANLDDFDGGEALIRLARRRRVGLGFSLLRRTPQAARRHVAAQLSSVVLNRVAPDVVVNSDLPAGRLIV